MKYNLDNIELYHLPKEVISERILEGIELPENVIGIDVNNLAFMEFNDIIIGINIDCNFLKRKSKVRSCIICSKQANWKTSDGMMYGLNFGCIYHQEMAIKLKKVYWLTICFHINEKAR